MSRILPQIDHIVVLMLENRSLDNLLGWLYADQDNRPAINVPMPLNGLPTYDGVPPDFSNPDRSGKEHRVTRGTVHCDIPNVDPFESYVYVNEQLFWPNVKPGDKPGSAQNPKPGQKPTMKGFLVNYSQHPKILNELEIMETYDTPKQLSVLGTLARWYGVSDRWFCSVPSQTYCNRGFAGAGTSCGLTDNHLLEPFDTPTIWNVLADHGFDDWKIYWQDALLGRYFLTRHLFPQIHGFDDHFDGIDAFLTAAKAGKLPAYSFLEPAWNVDLFGVEFANGNSYHPPGHLVPGEEMLAKIFDAITHDPEAWSKTLFVITFDEHGGTLDHVRPPWGAKPPWADPKASKKPARCEHGFEFDRFGVRVPTILASPWVRKETVFRSDTDVPYDHTSVLATILRWQGIEKKDGTWGLGSRTDAAPTFEAALNAEQPRSDLPPSLSGGSCSGTAAVEAASAIDPETAAAEEVTEFQESLYGLVVQNATNGRLAPEDPENQKIVEDMTATVSTYRELNEYFRRLRNRYA